MNQENGFRRKLRYGSISLAITAGVIAFVVLLNILLTAICTGKLWITDMTAPEMYTLSDDAKHLLNLTMQSANDVRPKGEKAEVEIIFCADPDMLKANDEMRYIYYTALCMEKECPEFIRVSTTNVWTNPSSVDDYRVNSFSSIYQNNIIVSSGTEFRVLSSKIFYSEGKTYLDPDLFSGERLLLRSIIAVSRIESPVCCLTTQHGEALETEEGRAQYSEFIRVLENAGYEVRLINLQTDEIPDECRLIICFDPQTDFLAGYATGGVSEIEKLDDFLEDSNSFMVFTDADTPELYNLEEFLGEWGIAYERYEAKDENGKNVTVGNTQVVDAEHAIDASGKLFYAQYPIGGMGDSALADLQKVGGSPKILFGNASSISMHSTYVSEYEMANKEEGTEAYSYGHYYRNGIERMIFDVFTSGKSSISYAKKDGSILQDAQQNPIYDSTLGNYKLMTLSRQLHKVSEGQGWTQVDKSSHVCAIASTEFASNAVLNSGSYGNTDVLLSVLREIGQEIEPVGIDYKVMDNPTIDPQYYTASEATVWAIVLALIPAILCTVIGTVILVKRRART